MNALSVKHWVSGYGFSQHYPEINGEKVPVYLTSLVMQPGDDEDEMAPCGEIWWNFSIWVRKMAGRV